MNKTYYFLVISEGDSKGYTYPNSFDTLELAQAEFEKASCSGHKWKIEKRVFDGGTQISSEDVYKPK